MGENIVCEMVLCMLILSFAVRSLCDDLANLPLAFWSCSQISHDAWTVREHAEAALRHSYTQFLSGAHQALVDSYGSDSDAFAA